MSDISNTLSDMALLVTLECGQGSTQYYTILSLYLDCTLQTVHFRLSAHRTL